MKSALTIITIIASLFTASGDLNAFGRHGWNRDRDDRGSGDRTRPRRHHRHFPCLAAEFDADGDGELSREERAAAIEARRAEFVERFDENDDGELSDEALGSAGALRKIQDHSGLFDDTFVVMCGDAVLDLDLTSLVSFHRQKGALATIAVQSPPNLAVVVIDNEHYAETGMQDTHTGHGVDLSAIAAAAGFRRTATVYDERELEALIPVLFGARGPVFADVKVTAAPAPEAAW